MRASAPISHALAAGVLVWGAYAIAYVSVHGVLLDESVVPAQIITGAVTYPPGHPHYVYYPEAYSLGNYLSAAIFKLTSDPWLISALRNWLGLFCATYLPFALVLVLTSRPAWGHVAVALTLSEAAIAFQGVYPLWVFPATYSTGNVSLHIALLGVVLLLANSWRAAGLVIGLLPSIHPALALFVWGWTAAYMFVERARLPRCRLFAFGAAMGLGLAVCAALAAVVLLQVVRINAAGAANYVAADLDGDLVRRQFIALSDVHRQLFPWPSVGYLLNPVAFAVVSGLLLWRSGRSLGPSTSRRGAWLALLGGLAWAAIAGAGLFQASASALPELVGTLMPYRLSNVTAVLLIPLAVAGLAAASARINLERQWLIHAAVGLLLLVVAVRVGLDRTTMFRYGLYVVLGAVLGAQMSVDRRDLGRLLTSIALLVGLAGLAWSLGLRREVAYLLSSWGAMSLFVWASQALPRRSMDPGLAHAAGGLLLVVGSLGAALGGSVSTSIWDTWDMVYDVAGNPTVRWDAVSPYDQALGDWLRANAQPDEMILSALLPRSELQAKVGHPVLFELETLHLMTYIPSLAGTTGMLARDLYGIDYTQPDQLAHIAAGGRLPPESPAWLTAWAGRSRASWQELSAKYGFRLVLAPSRTRLDLSAALPGPVWTLYTIP